MVSMVGRFSEDNVPRSCKSSLGSASVYLSVGREICVVLALGLVNSRGAMFTVTMRPRSTLLGEMIVVASRERKEQKERSGQLSTESQVDTNLIEQCQRKLAPSARCCY